MPPGSWSNLVSSRISGRVRRMISAIASTCALRFRISLMSRPAPRRPSWVLKVAIRIVCAESGTGFSARATSVPSSNTIGAAIAAIKTRARLVNRARLCLMATGGSVLRRHRIEPRGRLAPLGLMGSDIVNLFEAERDIVEPVQQAVLAERIDLEAQLAAIRPLDRL